MKITRRQLRKLIEQEVKVVVVDKDSKLKADELKKSIQNNPENSDVPPEDIEAAIDKITENKVKDISSRQIDNAIISCLKREGGAAGMGMLVDAVMSLETKTKKLPKNLSSKAKIKKYIAKHPKLLIHKYKDIILVQGLPRRK